MLLLFCHGGISRFDQLHSGSMLCLPQGCRFYFLWLLFSVAAKEGQREMSGRGLYRTKMPDGRAEYARVLYGIASAPGEVPRPLYEARGCEPPFDTLPTKEEHEAARARNSDEADSGEAVAVSLSAEAFAVIADRAPDASEEDNHGGYRMSLPRPVLNRLLQLREPNDKSFSDVILRLARE
jgi:hypothetical protein